MYELDRGQGLNNSIHDVAGLARALKANGNDKAAAVTEYEREMWPRGREAVASGNENSLSTHDWNNLLKSPLFTAGVQQKVANSAD